MMREPAFSLLEKPVPISLRGRRVLVLGLGDTGLSAARWVERSGGVPRVADTRPSPPRKRDFHGELHSKHERPDSRASIQLIGGFL